MIKSILLVAAFAVTSIVSSQAHCGSCEHKDDKKCEQKDGKKGECDKDKKDSKKSEEKK
jgi:hypothetical protein